ncbi:MAG: glycoside hydrolase family 15 protein [Minwuia sp.]|uniref:glycoside hydrolase family 15 protein n=1 Tax=Minwuia sp. TaxID=2493630 RepID=UPI003A865A00
MKAGVIGNCAIAAVVDADGAMNWLCLPRFDGEPVFHALLGHGAGEPGDGAFAIELEGLKATSQSYDVNTAVIRTVLEAESGSVEVIDFAPRFEARGRMFRPQMIVRVIRPVSGWPRIRIRLRPRFNWGSAKPTVTRGSNHIRYVGPDDTIRLTTTAPVDHILDERVINLDRPYHFVLGPDESLSEHPGELAERFLTDTRTYWQRWSRRLAVPLEWQDAVIRAAITLKLCSYEPTGAIIAAVTTSIPKSANSGRNWDYRYCWVRDAFFTVRALNSLAATRTLENYFQWLMNVVADAAGGHIQPVLGVGLERQLTETFAENLQGYRGMGPVRVGNQAFEHFQHDTYGNIILGAAPAFFDQRLYMNTGVEAFQMLEPLGEQAWRLHDKEDAGIWELRTRARVHTSSSLMCWAACDRLAKIADRLELADRAQHWGGRAAHIRKRIYEEAWSEKRQAFVESFGGETLDASVLLMGEVGMIEPKDPRFVATVERLSETLGRGAFMLRYEEADDFGEPEVGFNVCAFWRLDALAKVGRHGEAREHFTDLLAARNPLGLMSEDTDFRNGEAWGNFPQTYSMVGIINGATRLSKSWESTI